MASFLEEWFRRHGIENPAERAERIYAQMGGPTRPASEPDTGMPPFMTFDPAITAEQEALERGLEDLLQDTKLERRYAKRDFKQTKKDLRQDLRRGKQDLRRDLNRGVEDINVKRTDVQTDLGRGREDFNTRINTLIHNYQTQGQQQYEAANATGVLDGTTQAASAAARAGNFARDRAPLDTGLARMEEDAARQMTLLGTTEGRLRADVDRSRTRLGQDVRHDKRLARQALKRQMRDIQIRRQRARREAAIGEMDLTQQAIFQARETHPGAFSKSGDRRRKGNRP